MSTVPDVEDGERYWIRVDCLAGWSGSATLHVPEYARLRAVAVGCAVSALLLAALALGLYVARDRLCPARNKRRR